MQITQANYPAVKANLEAVGFTGLPAESEIAWEAPLPFNVSASISFKANTVSTTNRNLTPA